VNPSQIIVTRELADSQRRKAAEILFDAFEDKFRPLLRNREVGLKLIAEIMDPKGIFVAMRDGEPVGIAGVRYDGLRLLRIKLRTLIRHLGLFRGLLARYIDWLCLHDPEPDYVLLEFAAVSAAARSQGVGSLLISAVCELAKSEGKRGVTLDVVDTNPRAQQLYERSGFAVVSVKEFPRLRGFFGFGAVSSMVKTV
jgi:ribosomal protein S18 acetylase RimI-like enzyme